MAESGEIHGLESAGEPQDKGDLQEPTVLDFLRDISNKFDCLREDVEDLKARAGDTGSARDQPLRDADFSSSEAESSTSSSSSSASKSRRHRR